MGNGVSDNFTGEGVWLVPDPSPFPSLETNNARFAPFLGKDGPVDLSTVDPMAAIEAPDQSMIHTPQGPNNMLAKLRQQFPHLDIMPLPPSTRAITLAAGVPQDLVIPSGIVIGSFMATVGVDWYMSLHGNAQVPSAANTGQASINTPGECSSFKVPASQWFFLAGVTTISFVSPVACNITGLFYSPSELPR